MASNKTQSEGNDGGYEYNFVKEPPDTTICVICQLPSRDPYLSVCCGHVFCKSCLDNTKKVAANCPMCRSEEFVVYPNKQIERIVKCLHVYCMNKEKGCKWQGEVNYISDHLGRNDGCDFEGVQCSNKCEEIVQRQCLVGHMEAECPRRMVGCQYCGVDGEYQLIEGEHKELCPKFPLPCPNKCDVGSVPRQDMTEHRKMCPLEEVECSNKCGKILQRQYLDSHLETKCPRRIVNCQYCQFTGEHQFIEGQHKEQCPKFPLPCPNNCDSELKVSREDMDRHRKECPLETVQCQYQCVGCDDVMVRKHKSEHNKENMEEHLALAVSELMNSRQQQKALEQKLQDEFVSMKVELATVKEELTTTKHRSSVVYAKVLATEIKQKLPSIEEEVTKMLSTGILDDINQRCQDVEGIKRKLAQEVSSAVEEANQLVEGLRMIAAQLQYSAYTVRAKLALTSTKKEKQKEMHQIVHSAKQNIEIEQGQLLQNITQTEEEIHVVHQKLVDNSELMKSVNEMISQLDTLMKDLAMFGETSAIISLNIVKTDTLKRADKIMKLAQQKKDDIVTEKKKIEAAKADIIKKVDELLKQLADEHDQAAQRIKNIHLRIVKKK